MDEELWGGARVTHPDWKGTAQLDERATAPWEGLARTFGLSSDQWQVVGFSIAGGESGLHLRVLATPSEAWKKVEPQGGAAVEVTEFLVHNIDPLEVLQQMTHMFDLRMRHRALGGREVRVMSQSDLPSDLFVEENFGPQAD